MTGTSSWHFYYLLCSRGGCITQSLSCSLIYQVPSNFWDHQLTKGWCLWTCIRGVEELLFSSFRLPISSGMLPLRPFCL